VVVLWSFCSDLANVRGFCICVCHCLQDVLTESAGLLRVDASYSALFSKHINDHDLLYPKKKTLRACYVRRITTPKFTKEERYKFTKQSSERCSRLTKLLTGEMMHVWLLWVPEKYWACLYLCAALTGGWNNNAFSFVPGKWLRLYAVCVCVWFACLWGRMAVITWKTLPASG
jgi:hypothetical protein